METIFLTSAYFALILGGVAAFYDVRGMTIPNMISVMVIALFGLSCLVMPERYASLWGHMSAAAIMFSVTYLLFLKNMIGGGDSKLATAFAFWLGLRGLVPFLFFMALVGGLLAIATLVLRKRTLLAQVPENSWIGRAQSGEDVLPYGVAICAGAVMAFHDLGYMLPMTL